ncbi:MAG: hypothetical protein U1E10_08365 [Bdellovibrionales bacterium]|nr:hypothetical protein [Bdellovibrionales bacterium]
MTNLGLDEVVALNALIVTAIGLSLAFGRRERKTGPLDLGGPRRMTAVDELGAKGGRQETSRALTSQIPPLRTAQSNGNPGGRNISGRSGAPRGHGGNEYGAAALRRLEEENAATSRQLNVFFNWNGHTWDAFEVLGVPAGASRESVIQAFHLARSKSPDSIAFLQAAADAILKGPKG